MEECSSCNHRTIPIFIPGAACPHHCVYCNQQVISGQRQVPDDEEILFTVRQHLATIPAGTHVEIGFFGGTFTGLPIAEQERLLRLVYPFVESGQVKSLRCSTHPLCISEVILQQLRRYGMTTVELGVQSLDDGVLSAVGRGYTARQVHEAAQQIRDAGLSLGMQMMVGLPGDSADKSFLTAQHIVEWGADNTRIYPTLVVQHTGLAELYRQGKYQPLTMAQAVEWVRRPLRLFQESGVTVLRVGLHPTPGFISGADYLAGPFHVSFKELVQTAIWQTIFKEYVDTHDPATTPAGHICFHVCPKQLTSAIGHYAANRQWLRQYYRKVSFQPDASLHNYEYKAETV